MSRSTNQLFSTRLHTGFAQWCSTSDAEHFSLASRQLEPIGISSLLQGRLRMQHLIHDSLQEPKGPGKSRKEWERTEGEWGHKRSTRSFCGLIHLLFSPCLGFSIGDRNDSLHLFPQLHHSLAGNPPALIDAMGVCGTCSCPSPRQRLVSPFYMAIKKKNDSSGYISTNWQFVVSLHSLGVLWIP